MICPHCGQEIDPREIARHLGARGGAIGGKAKTPEKLRAVRRNLEEARLLRWARKERER